MSDVTRLIQAIGDGDSRATAELLPIVYDELRRLARLRMANERAGHTLEATALVHEAYLRLVGDADPNWSGRGHFFAAAAEAMRRILVENARRKASLKHGGEFNRVELNSACAAAAPPSIDLLALDESLQGLDVAAALQRLQAANASFAVLKPTALGGLTHCLALAERAQKIGIRAVISHCFDGPLAFRAAAALALALPADVAHGLSPHAALAGWPEPNPPAERGWLKAWSEPGLGLAPGRWFE